MDTKNIIIVGAGEIGSRHLQALTKCDFPVNLYVYDLNETSLSRATKRYEESRATNVNSIKFITSYNGCITDDVEFDLAIIATSSKDRLSAFKQLVKTVSIRNLLFEKVLFTKLTDYSEAESLLHKYNIPAYVNCPKRDYLSTKIIKDYIGTSEKIHYYVSGTNWGLACNAIHFIDTMSVYSKNLSYQLDTDGLENEILSSKRPGYIELCGSLYAKFTPERYLHLLSNRGEIPAFFSKIETERYIFSLDEAGGSLEIEDNEDGDKLLKKVIQCPTPRQSELTHIYAEQIIFEKKTNLPTFIESKQLHLPFIEGLLKFYNNMTETNSDTLLIT